MADVGHQRFTKSVFNTPPLTEKSSKKKSNINWFDADKS